MRYNLNVTGKQFKLIRASIVNFQRSLTLSEQGDFDELIDELDDCYLKLTLQQKEQLKIKIDKRWGKKKMNQFEAEIKRRLKKYHAQLAELENAFYNHEIADKDYVVEYEKIKAKIQLLE